MKGWFKRLACGVCSAFLLACSQSQSRDSEQVGNLNIRAELQAASSGTGAVEVSARLLESGTGVTTYLRLSGNDSLYASNGTTYQETTQSSGGLFSHLVQVSSSVAKMTERNRVVWDLLFIRETTEPEYYTRFQESDASLPFYVTLRRTADDSIHDAEIRLPLDFEILSPQAGASISRVDPVTVQWSLPDSSLNAQLDIAARCGTDDYTATKDLGADTGTAQITAADIFGSTLPAGSCSVALALRKVWNGSVPTVFGGGGTATGVQRRSVSFVSTP